MDDVNVEVVKLIEFIKKKMKEMNLNAEEVFLNGNCGDLYKIFVSKFPKYTTPFLITYNEIPYHIITKIQDRFYDITGETNLEKYIKYVKENNATMHFNEEEFKMEQLSVANPILHRMCGQYRYNENFEQSEISNEMHRLLENISEYDKSKNEH